MRHLFVLLLLAFVVGDCVTITKGIFKGQKWTVLEVNGDGTYDLKDKDWTLRDVRGSYLLSCEPERKRDNWGR